MEPGGDADAHLIVTDRRVLGMFGDEGTEAEFSFDAWSIVRAKGRDGLLSSTLEVATPEETIRFVPDDGTDVGRVATTIERVGDAWTDLYDALASVEAAMEEYEDRVADGTDPASALTNVRSRLSQAHHCATKTEYAPEPEMLAEIEPVENEVDQLRVTARLDHAADLLDDAERSREDEPEAAIEAVLAADEELDEAKEIHGEVGSTSISQRLTDLVDRLDDVGEALFGDALVICRSAADADDPGTALSRWEDAMERYRTMLDAGWDGQAGVGEERLQYQLAWVLGNRTDALRARADALEAEGDETDDTEKFELALDCRKKARSIETECPFGDRQADTDAIERLEDKIARSEWEWGDA